MAWVDTLLDASFRGIKFNITSTSDAIKNNLAIYEYPFVDGADVRNLGRAAIPHKINAVFWGRDYEAQLQQFIQALNEPAAGEFIHPVFGVMQCAVSSYTIEHTADIIDYCTVSIELIESKKNQPFFAREFTPDVIDKALSKIETAFESLKSQLDNTLYPIRKLFRDAERARQFCNSILFEAYALRGEHSKKTQQLSDYVRYPSAFISELREVFAPKKHSIDLIYRVVEFTRTPRTTTGRVNGVINEVSVTCAALSAATQLLDIFDSEFDNSTLSIVEIEQATAVVRSAINAAIAAQRAIDSDTAIDTLKETALKIQEISSLLINQRPPIIKYHVEVDCVAQWLAHHLYNDATRAKEFLRLNPKINLNKIKSGESLYVYAR